MGIGNLPVKLVGGVPGFLSDGNGPTHQAIEDVALMRGIPHMHVFCPADEQDMLLALPHIINSPNPTLTSRYNGLKPVVNHAGDFSDRPGRTSIGRDGHCHPSSWNALRPGREAGALLEAEGLSVRLISVRMPKPIDEEAVLRRPRDESAGHARRSFPDRRPLLHRCRRRCCTTARRPTCCPFALDRRWFRPALLNDVFSTGASPASKSPPGFWSGSRPASDQRYSPVV